MLGFITVSLIADSDAADVSSTLRGTIAKSTLSYLAWQGGITSDCGAVDHRHRRHNGGAVAVVLPAVQRRSTSA